MEQTRYYNPDELRTREFNKFIDDMLTKGIVTDESFNALTPVQKDVYSVLNRAFARLQRNNGEEHIHKIT